jgi:3-deoxy-D-manno-octulosonic-acid transferase
MYLAYDICLHLALLGSLPYLLVRRRWAGKSFPGLSERLGRLPAGTNPHRLTGIWVQAVSVGEVRLAAILIPAIRGRTADARFYVSTTTTTGQRLARQSLARWVDAFLFFPLDLPQAARRTVDRLCPALFIALETEIWPNLLRFLSRRQVPSVIVNGRISAGAFGRYRRFRFFFRRVLANLDLALMQTEEDANRIVELGLPRERVRVTGSIKFDLPPPDPEDGTLAERLGIRPDEVVFIAGSTMRGEEEMVLDAYDRASHTCRNPLLVLAPRHPERFDEVADLLAQRGTRFQRRSKLREEPVPERQVLLLDSLGELARLYGRGRVTFVGGSLVPRGGHNILEPAVHGKPVLFGPHMENFRDIARRMIDGGGGLQVDGVEQLGNLMGRLVEDEIFFRRAGEAARAVVEANRGALQRTLENLEPYLRRFSPATC